MSEGIGIKDLLHEIQLLRQQTLDIQSNVMNSISELRNTVSRLEALEAQQEKDVLEFWAERWGPLKTDIKDIKNRLERVEVSLTGLDFSEIEDRLDDLEKSEFHLSKTNLEERVTTLERAEYKRQGFAALLGAIAGGVGSYLLKLLSGGS